MQWLETSFNNRLIFIRINMSGEFYNTTGIEIQLEFWIRGFEQLNNSGLINDKRVTFDELNFTLPNIWATWIN